MGSLPKPLNTMSWRSWRLAEWLKRSGSDQKVAGTNPSYDSIFDAAACGKLRTSGIGSLMPLASREPGVNLIIIIIIIIIGRGLSPVQ